MVTTVNIQHLESLNDLEASITGVRVRETLYFTISACTDVLPPRFEEP